MLPSRSALSDLGLIAYLFEKILLNWSSFWLKSPHFGLKIPKSLIFTFFPSLNTGLPPWSAYRQMVGIPTISRIRYFYQGVVVRTIHSSS